MAFVERLNTKSKFVFVAAALIAVLGVVSYFRLGRLEDPEFTVKRTVVTTLYPGASALEVEQEVTDLIETVVQEMHELDEVHSISRPGMSIIFVDIKEVYWADELEQIWDKLRRKINDAEPRLPPGASLSMVQDDFGDVFGVLLAITADGFRYGELEDYVDDLRRELMLVQDVGRVDLWGVRQECVYVEISRNKLAEFGIPPEMLLMTLAAQNMVVDPGHVNMERERVRLRVTGEFESVEQIGELMLRGVPGDVLVRLADVAEVRRGYIEPPREIMRFNGRRAIGLAIAVTGRGNVVRMGEAIHQRLDELMAEVPVGIEVGVVSFQPDRVEDAIREFTTNLVTAVAIVVVLLLVFLGLRSGLMIGMTLLLTIAATFVIMRMMAIDLHRVSLGALIISLGMLVDNAVVVTEGSYVRFQRGQERLAAVAQTVRETAWPLLAATIVAALAFMPIYLSPDDVGEYAGSLFQVVAISLLASWALSVTVIPLASQRYLKVRPKAEGKDPQAGRVYCEYRSLLEYAIHHRLITVIIVVVLLILSIIGFFLFIEQEFFPEAVRAQLQLDYWLPEGANIETTSDDLKTLEQYVLEQPEVESVGSFVGAGPPRFYLPMDPEMPNPSFGQLIINLTDTGHLVDLQERLYEHLAEFYPHAEPRVLLFALGPAARFKIEARFIGPDIEILRELAEQAKTVMRQDPQARDVRHDWRQKVKRIDTEYDQRRGRWAMVTRQDLASSIRMSFDGQPIGVYREKDDLLPIILRLPEEQRHKAGDLASVRVWGQTAPANIPLEQAVQDISVVWEDPIIRRRDRRRTISAMCDPWGTTADELFNRLRPNIEAIPLPEGYQLEWGGEHEMASEARATIYDQLPLIGALMALTLLALFNSFRKTLLIIILLPLAVIGITIGLLIVGIPFGFMALIGGVSLAGMLIKNSVVLIEQININTAAGAPPYNAVVDAAVSRMRPVLLASMTTVMGMIPLLFDRFWTSMGVTITFGLTFGTVLTLIILPVLYTLLFKIEPAEAPCPE